MLPSWLKFQRVSLFLYLAAGVLLLVYALGFITDVYIFYAYGNNRLIEFYHDMQKINNALLWKALFVIIFSLILFLLELGKRPAGLFTFFMIIIIMAASIFICVNSIVVLTSAREQYAALDLSSLNRYIERGAITYEYSTRTYDIGLGGYSLFLFSSILMTITVIRNAFMVKEAKFEEPVSEKEEKENE